MTNSEIIAVDEYFTRTLVQPDAALDAALAATEAAGVPAINVTPSQGKLLHLLAHMQDARRILEIGTLGGYSTIWLARALPAGGQLISLEVNPHHAAVARANLERAGVADRVEVRVGRAVDTLRAMAEAQEPPFDFIFIDADKPSNPAYLEWSLRLAHPGTVIVVDNVVRGGRVADAASTDADVTGVRTMVDAIITNPQLNATAIQTVGAKGHDGFALIRVN